MDIVFVYLIIFYEKCYYGYAEGENIDLVSRDGTNNVDISHTPSSVDDSEKIKGNGDYVSSVRNVALWVRTYQLKLICVFELTGSFIVDIDFSFVITYYR